MFGKIFASIILITVLYIFGVFFAPNLTDTLAEKLGTSSVNTLIRQLKNGADSTSETLLQIKDASGAISNVRGIVNQANEKINKTTEMINTIRQTWEQKMEQVQKTTESIKKAGEAFAEVQNNISSLTSLSGSITESGATAGTGK
ncbi:MAG: hypothetical protein ACD_78C00197G0025 [uncultured bacterium (gcode 4)]|uniref:Uncharacterized protein n=1 Tax=uncultured bacterium (gcode 4) TaxID=1234023 RepID=K1XI20_9BACT|nr:MAG: hypothetical protein ACD_78C00197G0025 [uncultured bacterium (gcode 4)]